MKSFKTFTEEQKHMPKVVDNGFGLVAIMPDEVMISDKVDINIIDKLVKRSMSESLDNCKSNKNQKEK